MRILMLAIAAWCWAGPAASPPAAAAETGDLARLRAEALALVNAARSERGLGALVLTDSLNAAAQAHARDMLERGYYAHVSPDGKTVQDRHVAQGGGRWRLTAENIARCRGCPSPPTRERVQSFHDGWMDSPGHRENILREGIEQFGFGIVAGGDRLYAVQTFAGPGMPPRRQRGEPLVRLSPEEQAERAVRAINRARADNGLARLAHSAALDRVAGRLLADDESGRTMIDRPDSLFKLLPEREATAWRALRVVTAACGGCGAALTAADVRHFAAQWLDNPEYRQTLLDPALAHLGFAMRAGGDGRKAAVAVLGRRR